MTREALEAKNPADRFGGVYVEVYRGYKIRIQRHREWGRLTVTIAGESSGTPYGRTNADVLSEARYARAYINDSHERPDAYSWSSVPA